MDIAEDRISELEDSIEKIGGKFEELIIANVPKQKNKMNLQL